MIGNDVAMTLAAEAGQLQLNAMEPLIVYQPAQRHAHAREAMTMLDQRCIRGITANAEHCEDLVRGSIGIVTALNPYIGYHNATRIAKRALETGRGVVELVLEEGLLSGAMLDEVLQPRAMLGMNR